MEQRTFILGAGVTGLAAGYASGWPMYEAAAVPGGICSSYYVRPGTTQRLAVAPDDGEAYRFEVGGGHWVFGGDPVVLRFIRQMTPVKTYHRHSAVYFAKDARIIPFPLQYHLAHLDDTTATQALHEITTLAHNAEPPTAMDAWLAARFGPTLTTQFFGPFHERYTAGLWTEIAPQDPYKSPVDVQLVQQGRTGKTTAAGYNTRYLYPEAGLDALARQIAQHSTVHYGKRAVHIDPIEKIVSFEDGTEQRYETLISTLPLNKMIAMAGLKTGVPDPYTSVLVLNIGAVRGAACPDHHWLYVPDSASGFFRVGCYSNVESSFLPRSARAPASRVSLYIERAFPGGQRPSEDEVQAYAVDVVRELQAWDFIAEAEVVDPTWIEVAYTWARPGSTWRKQALATLDAHDIVMVGRYARWIFQGIADSIRDGFIVGAAFKRREKNG
ncbi:MAG TPA: hypothetical protein VKP65_00495 [Rhodothermales bacterium]|nr:hypothetical protein [Rhodothermales bacterium]